MTEEPVIIVESIASTPHGVIRGFFIPEDPKPIFYEFLPCIPCVLTDWPKECAPA